MNKKLITLFLASLLTLASVSQPLQICAQDFAASLEAPGTEWNISPRPANEATEKKISIGVCDIVREGNLFRRDIQENETQVNENVGHKILNIISLYPAEKPEAVLARELQIRLGVNGKYAEFFYDDGEQLKLTASGCDKIINLLIFEKSNSNFNVDIDVKEIPAILSIGAFNDGKISAKIDALGKSPFLGDSFFDGAALSRELSDETNIVEMDESAGDDNLPESSFISDKISGPLTQSPPALEIVQDSGLPPSDTWKGRFARTFGIVGSATGVGAVSGLLWGPAAMAYHITGSVIKSMKFNSDLFGKAEPVVDVIDKHSTLLRIMAGSLMLSGGVITGNPVASYFGMSFVVTGIGDIVGKTAYNAADKALQKPSMIKLGKKIDDKLKKVHDARNKPLPEEKKRSKLSRMYDKFTSKVYNNRGKIARTVLASAVSIGAVCGFAGATHMALSNTLGKMAVKKGELSSFDKIRNNTIGAYRFYNMPGTVFKSGENTKNFYQEMKIKYKPETPEAWANVIEKEITWVYHADLYGTELYFLSSEEAAKIATHNGLAGRYSDCTGKAALLQNMLKMDGFGSSEIVFGTPKLGSGQKMGHAWLIRKDSAGNVSELFHYDHTKNLLYSQQVSSSQGIKGDNMAETVGGSVGGILTEFIYKSYSNGQSGDGGGIAGALTNFVYKIIGGDEEDKKKA